MSKKLVIIGACGFGKEVAWLAKACGVEVLGFLDDDQSLEGGMVWDLPVLGILDEASNYLGAEFLVAIGNPSIRKKIVEKVSLQNSSIKWASLVHPSVELDESITLGNGSVITAGCTLTVDIAIGEHCIVNINSTVGHDSVFGNYVTVAPLVAVSGNVTLADGVEVGPGAAIRQGVIMGENSRLGMGGVLTKDQPAETVYVGNTAKVLAR